MRPDLLPTTTDTKLAHIIEECGEVVQAYGKLHRFGSYATDLKTGITYDNESDIHTEIKQLKDAIERYLQDFV